MLNSLHYVNYRLMRERSNIIWRLGRGFAQTVRIPSMGEGVWPNRHITFTRAWEPERPEPHDLAGAGVGAILFFFRSRSTLKNWNGVRAGIGIGII